MLSIENLQITRDKSETGFQINLPRLHLQDGEIIALRGASGCGKSTILEILGLILKPAQLSSYQLGFESNIIDIAPLLLKQAKELAAIRAKYFGFMLQSGGLLPFLNIRQNIGISCELLNKPLNKDWLKQMAERLKISHLMEQYPKHLSIGERQRVSFLRSIAHQPMVLLADEPTAALDPQNSEILFETIIQLVKENHLSAIIVTHDWEGLKEYNIPFLTAQISEGKATFS